MEEKTNFWTIRIQDLMDAAKAAGVSLTEVCDAVGASRQTTWRWMQKPPKSAETLQKMEEYVAGRLQKLVEGQ